MASCCPRSQEEPLRILVIIDDRVSAYQYAAEGCFTPLDDTLKDIGLNVDDFFAGMKDVMYYDDTCYLIPQDSNVIMLFYNPDIAKECGLDPENPAEDPG